MSRLSRLRVRTLRCVLSESWVLCALVAHSVVAQVQLDTGSSDLWLDTSSASLSGLTNTNLQSGITYGSVAMRCCQSHQTQTHPAHFLQ